MLMRLDEALFKDEILSCPGLALVKFYKDGCKPCEVLSRGLRHMAPDLEAAGVRLYEVNYADAEAVFDRYGVTATPVVILFRDGKEFARFRGMVVSKAAILAKISGS